MGILRNRGNDDDDRRAAVPDEGEAASIGDDYWIEDEQGNRAYRVDGKAVRVVTRSCSRTPPARRSRRSRSASSACATRSRSSGTDEALATVHKALVGIRDRFAIDVDQGADLKAHGNVVDHEYEIERDGDSVAQISKRWFRVRDTYGVEVEQGEDVGLVLAITVALESMTED